MVLPGLSGLLALHVIVALVMNTVPHAGFGAEHSVTFVKGDMFVMAVCCMRFIATTLA